jgi:hypothetical protein
MGFDKFIRHPAGPIKGMNKITRSPPGQGRYIGAGRSLPVPRTGLLGPYGGFAARGGYPASFLEEHHLSSTYQLPARTGLPVVHIPRHWDENRQS